MPFAMREVVPSNFGIGGPCAGALVVIKKFGTVSVDHDLIARLNSDMIVEMMGGWPIIFITKAASLK